MLRKDGFLVLVSLVLSAVSANAVIITIEVTAEISQVGDRNGLFVGNIQVGDQLVLTYSYNSETPDSSPMDQIGKYSQVSPCGVVVTVGNYVFRSNQENLDYHLSATLGHDYHTYFVMSRKNLMPEGLPSLEYFITWQLNDYSKTALEDDSLPLIPPNLNDWNQDLQVRLDGLREFHIFADTISVRAIPEPFSIALLGIGGMFLRRRF